MTQSNTHVFPDDIFSHDIAAKRISLFSPTSIPNASAFLWNSKMMLQMNCRGYASAQHMQPEPAKYSYGQSLEAKTFMQPEHHYHSSHPGRFFYIKVNGVNLFSLPYEPMRVPLTNYQFSQGTDDIAWLIEHQNIRFEIKVMLGQNKAVEIWQLSVCNLSNEQVDIDIYPCFSIGFASWMYQSAAFDPSLNGIVGKYITPYQKVEDYYKNQHLLDNTVLIADSAVVAFDTNLRAFEGEGGLQQPDALKRDKLGNSVALYQTPVAVMQHSVILEPNQSDTLNWLFGPVKDQEEAKQLAEQHFKLKPPKEIRAPNYQISTQNKDLDAFVNIWLPRQIQYHCQSNRLTRDPQTRNYLQDHMAEVLFEPSDARSSFLFALSQQSSSGAMPDGILLASDAELKYINQIPHSDHNVWLFIYLDTYLKHTNDLSLLDENLAFSDSSESKSVFEHLNLAAEYLYQKIDHRSLSYIEQGDWCDPMNMVGKNGIGVSIWLSLASAYAFDLFAQVCKKLNKNDVETIWRKRKQQLNDAVNQFGWDGNWYARGICDNGRVFGIANDTEGKIYLNPQAWSMLSGAASHEQTKALMQSVDSHLMTPFGVAMLAPAYTHMDEDIGRLTQKFPGTAENGSVYNHAACFYAYALLENGFADEGLAVLQKMLVLNEDVLARQQLPNFVPNYYRGAYFQFPDVAGRSSHLFNTGTCSWYYRCVIESMFGITQDQTGIYISPTLSGKLGRSNIQFKAFGSEISIIYEFSASIVEQRITANDLSVDQQYVSGFKGATHYNIHVLLPNHD